MKAALQRLPLAVLAAACLLSGCADKSKQANCPGMVALAEAARESVFREGTSPDPSNVLYTVQVVGVKGTCDIDKKAHTADASIDIHFRATRAPTGASAQYSVPYFVAVTQADRIINKKAFQAQFAFVPGEAVADFTDTVGSTEIDPEKGKHPYDYQILVGLPLTKAQLDYNRTIGRFTQ
jgi:hypothetical protein